MEINSIAINKRQLRTEKLSIRDKMDIHLCEEKSQKICDRVISSDIFIKSDTVLLYYDYRNEVSTTRIFKAAMDMDKKVAYPKCSLLYDTPTMDFYYINDFRQFSEGYKGIKEPDIAKYNLDKCENAMLCILPCSVFDEKCHRIGYGKGFYDRFLANHPSIHKIAIAYELQKADIFDVEATDIDIDAIYTEKTIYKR